MDETTKLLVESLNKNIEMIRREIMCKIDDLNLRNGENFQDLKNRLSIIESNMKNFVKFEDCEKKQTNEVTKQEYKFKTANLIVGAIAGFGGSLITLVGTLFANGTIHLP